MAPKRPFRPDAVWQLCSVADPQVSPDGRRVAYVVGVPDPATDTTTTSIWVAPTDASAVARPFSAGPKDASPRWSPDGSRLAFVADRGTASSGPQLYVAPLDGGDARPITAAPFGVASPAWSPDGSRLAYVARTGDWKEPADRTAIEKSAPRIIEGLYNRFDSVGWSDGRRAHVFVVTTAGGEPRQVTEGDWDDTDPAWSPDGRQLAFVSDRAATRADIDHRDVWVVAAQGRGRPRRLTRGLGTVAAPRWSPDGATIAFVGHEHGAADSAGNTHLLVVDVDGEDPPPPRSLSGPLDRTVAGLVRPIGGSHAWTADGSAVLFLAGDGGAQRIYRAARNDPRPRVVVGGDRQILALATAGETIAFVPVWPSTPPEVVCTTGGRERRVSDVNGPLRATTELAPLRRTRHATSDGHRIDAFVLYPPGFTEGTPAPTVLEIHGGPHGMHPQASMMPLYQSLAAAGYVVILANPRGSQGYGEDFARACVGDWGGRDFSDLMGSLDALVGGSVADPGCLFVAGYSYGGFMTSWAVGHTDRFRAACVSAPVINLVSMWGTTDIPYFAEGEIGGAPWEVPEAYRAHSPLTYVADITTPVLLLHWEGDLRCPVGQADELFQGLRRLGREVALVRYPGGFHVSRTPSQFVDFITRHLDWFKAHASAGPAPGPRW